MTDIPYEKVAISQSMIEPNKIVAWDFFGGEDNIILMAEYSTSEKAEKAMQMLHSYYGDYMIEKVYKQEIRSMWPVFQFPQEDEI